MFSPHPRSRRLLVAGSVRRIIGGFNFREPLHAGGVDLGDPVLEGGAFDLILDLAVPENAFQGDELPLLEGLGELREIPPGKDAMPFSAGFVFAFSERSTSLTVRIMWSSIVLPLKSRVLQRPFRHWVPHDASGGMFISYAGPMEASVMVFEFLWSKRHDR
jgi:hypothetical protein